MHAKASGKKISLILILIWSVSSCTTGGISESRQSIKPFTATLFSQFTDTAIIIDGKAEASWDAAAPSRISIAMNADLSATAPECPTYGTVRSMWDGALLYLLIEVTDADVQSDPDAAQSIDTVDIYLDLLNDKFPKNEEDDAVIRIGSHGFFFRQGVYPERLKSYAAAPRTDNSGRQIGYTVELALHTGGIPTNNGSSIGMDFGVNDAVASGKKPRYRIFWSSGNNRGIDDNTMWGNVVLSGHDGTTPMALDTYILNANIRKAEELPREIWTDETGLDGAIAAAEKTLNSKTQPEIDAAAAALDEAMKALRRKGRYPDPFDLQETNHLPDPFMFFDGSRIQSQKDWNARRKEIIDFAQYYEFGPMPDPPEAVTASIIDEVVTVSVGNNGRTASFRARLTLPSGKPGPYPVIVSIDFWPMRGNPTFLDAGYAVLSLHYSSVASDNSNHAGAFYELYPYDVVAGNDAGTLLGWAWGAGRCIDALQYLAANHPEYENVFDLEKLVVTGFSRCGKAALLAGLFDERFGVINPGASGSGGATPYRYDSYGNTPSRSAPFGNLYPWGRSTGAEVLGDHVRHQRHNSNEMLARFLNPDRIYKTRTHGYGERLPFDHHEIIAAIAPRAVIISTTNDDYANNAEGDSIGFEGAKPVYAFLDAWKNLAFDIRMTGGGHSTGESHRLNLIHFCNMVFFGAPLPDSLQVELYDNPYLGIYDAYYGGLKAMMPWKERIQTLGVR